MATSKTLTPTNQAITLAAFTEKPDNRINVTNDDRLADAVNALNSKMATLTYTGTVDNLQTSLESLASNMSVGEFRNIKYTAGETLAPFSNSRIYGGTFKRTGSNYWSVTLEDPEGVPVYGVYRNTVWRWEELALNSNITVKHYHFNKTAESGSFEKVGNFDLKGPGMFTIVCKAVWSSGKPIGIALSQSDTVYNESGIIVDNTNGGPVLSTSIYVSNATINMRVWEKMGGTGNAQSVDVYVKKEIVSLIDA